MKPAPFSYHAPHTVAEALEKLAQVGADGKVLAGGQSLVPLLTMRLAAPEHLVDIGGVAGLDAIAVDERWVRVGALVRHAGLERSTAADAALPLLGQAVRHVAHPAIRARGTTVGSIVHADPAGEMPAVLALTDGVVEVAGTRGTREVTSSELFLGALETSLAPDELVVAARFGRFPPGTRTAFTEFSRRSGDYALAGVAVAVEAGGDGAVTRVRASFVSVTPVPAVLDLSAATAGMTTGGPVPAAVAEAVRQFVEPESDVHATADYRRMLAAELTRRALADATASGPHRTATRGRAA
ncbi:MAG: FAD binding domain-containing protein [Phycicoccus sp.]